MNKSKSDEMVNIDKTYLRSKIKASGLRYVDLAKILGMSNDGSLTGMIAAQRINVNHLKTIARIVDFPYEEAIRRNKPVAYVKKQEKFDIRSELNKILSMQQEINTSLIKIFKEL